MEKANAEKMIWKILRSESLLLAVAWTLVLNMCLIGLFIYYTPAPLLLKILIILVCLAIGFFSAVVALLNIRDLLQELK